LSYSPIFRFCPRFRSQRHRNRRLYAGFAARPEITAAWGFATEQSRGKDTPSGHWEMMGVPVAVVREGEDLVAALASTRGRSVA